MATLMAPDYVDFGGVDEPQTIAVVVAHADIMAGGPPPIYTRELLMFPNVEQLIASTGAGYSQ